MLTAAEISPLQPYERTYVPGSELSPQSAFRGRQRAMEWHGFCHCNNSTHGAKICGRRDGEMRNPFAAVFVKGTLNWSKGSSRFLASGWGGGFFLERLVIVLISAWTGTTDARAHLTKGVSAWGGYRRAQAGECLGKSAAWNHNIVDILATGRFSLIPLPSHSRTR